MRPEGGSTAVLRQSTAIPCRSKIKLFNRMKVAWRQFRIIAKEGKQVVFLSIKVGKAKSFSVRLETKNLTNNYSNIITEDA